MEENGESSSFQISSSSGGMALPAIEHGSRTSSHSGESAMSGPYQPLRRSRQSHSRPRLPRRPEGIETESSFPSTVAMQSNLMEVDAREFHNTDSRQDFTANVAHFQNLIDARQMHVDARSVNVAMLDPQLAAQATEAVAGSRVQAAQEVAEVMVQATQAVSAARETSNTAQMHTHAVRAEAQAQIGALNQELQRALERERQLQQRVSAQGNEISTLHANMLSLARSPNSTPQEVFQQFPQEAANGAELLDRVVRMENQLSTIKLAMRSEATMFQSLSDRLTRIEENVSTQQEHLQEMWMNFPAAPASTPVTSGNGEEIGASPSPVHYRMDSESNVRPSRLEVPIPPRERPYLPSESNFCGGAGAQTPLGSASVVGGDVERETLRTKDLHHLRIPPLPESASHYRTWRNSLRTSILAYDQSVDGKLAKWLSDAFTLRGSQAIQLCTDSGDFPRMDRVLASLLCRQESLKTSFGLRIQAYVEQAEATGTQIRGIILNMVAQEFDVGPSASAINNALELFQLPPPGDGIGALKICGETEQRIFCARSHKVRSPKNNFCLNGLTNPSRNVIS